MKLSTLTLRSQSFGRPGTMGDASQSQLNCRVLRRAALFYLTVAVVSSLMFFPRTASAACAAGSVEMWKFKSGIPYISTYYPGVQSCIDGAVSGRWFKSPQSFMASAGSCAGSYHYRNGEPPYGNIRPTACSADASRCTWYQSDGPTGPHSDALLNESACRSCPTGYRMILDGSCVLGSSDGSNLGGGGGCGASSGSGGGGPGFGSATGGSAGSGDSVTEGNPINAATGNKYQRESDFVGSGRPSLNVWRSYNSFDSVSGGNWRWNFDARLVVEPYGDFGYYQIDQARITAIRPDGKELVFTADVTPADSYQIPTGTFLTSSQPTLGRLEKLASGFRYHSEDNLTEDYSASGRLLSISDLSGKSLTLSYASSSSTRLISVSDWQGRAIGFSYDTNGKRVSLTDPLGDQTQYAYNSNGVLATVTFPDGSSRIYHYEQPSFPKLLTGITDERGIRYATYSYDSLGRAVSSSHAGGAGNVALTPSFNFEVQRCSVFMEALLGCFEA